MYRTLASADCLLVIVHSIHDAEKAQRAHSDPDSIRERIEAFFDARIDALVRAGVNSERIVLDPALTSSERTTSRPCTTGSKFSGACLPSRTR